MNQALIDYYRCPAEFVNFTLLGEPGNVPGFFRFGASSICYGRCTDRVAPTVADDLADVSSLVRLREGAVGLPFDATQVLDNLRSERYVAAGTTNPTTVKRIVRKTYYLARPILGIGVRKHLQRFYLRGWQKIRFPSWPVDTTVDRINADLMSLCVRANGSEPIPFIWFWPEGYPGCAIVTHDVEHEPGRTFCDQLMDLDDSCGIKSSFQIVPEQRYRVSDRFRKGIGDRGFEVNVHDWNHDGSLFDDYDLFLRRAEKINGYARKYGAEGFRAGAVYRKADWFGALDFSYDMSVPNAAHLEPQRGGCCTVMPYFIGGLVELPLTAVQDYTLFQILGRYSTELWEKQIESITSYHGLTTFIVHPDYVREPRAQLVYRKLLQHLAELRQAEKLWLPLPRDAANWWRQRSQMRIVRDGDRWKIVGPGAERARLAFAEVEGGRLTYTLERGSVTQTARKKERCFAQPLGPALPESA